MPSKSQPQQNLMQGRAHGWKPDRLENSPSPNVAKKFNAADQMAKVRALRMGKKPKALPPHVPGSNTDEEM